MDFYWITESQVTALDEAPDSLPEGNGFLWLDGVYADIPLINRELAKFSAVQILAEHLEDASNRQHPSFFDSTSRYEMLVFRGLAIHPSDIIGRSKPTRLDSRPSTFFLLHRTLVTIHSQGSRTFERITRRLLSSEDGGPSPPVSPEELMLRIINDIVDRFLDLREPLSSVLEKIQFNLLDPRKPFRDWQQLLTWRLEVQRLQSLSDEQHDALQEWLDERRDRNTSVCGGPALNDLIEVRTINNIEHINRVNNHAARLESAVDSAVQLHFSQTANRSSEIMRVLTVITAIFMPLTLLTGIFGMNFEEIPGAKHPHGFWWAIGGLVLIALVTFLWFVSQRYVRTRGSAAPEALQYADPPEGDGEDVHSTPGRPHRARALTDRRLAIRNRAS